MGGSSGLPLFSLIHNPAHLYSVISNTFSHTSHKMISHPNSVTAVSKFTITHWYVPWDYPISFSFCHRFWFFKMHFLFNDNFIYIFVHFHLADWRKRLKQGWRRGCWTISKIFYKKHSAIAAGSKETKQQRIFGHPKRPRLGRLKCGAGDGGAGGQIRRIGAWKWTIPLFDLEGSTVWQFLWNLEGETTLHSCPSAYMSLELDFGQ